MIVSNRNRKSIKLIDGSILDDAPIGFMQTYPGGRLYVMQKLILIKSKQGYSIESSDKMLVDGGIQ